MTRNVSVGEGGGGVVPATLLWHHLRFKGLVFMATFSFLNVKAKACRTVRGDPDVEMSYAR